MAAQLDQSLSWKDVAVCMNYFYHYHENSFCDSFYFYPFFFLFLSLFFSFIFFLKWLKSITHLPIVLKGVLTPEDAQIAVSHGVSGIIVSNHGARQLDGVPASVSPLFFGLFVFYINYIYLILLENYSNFKILILNIFVYI